MASASASATTGRDSSEIFNFNSSPLQQRKPLSKLVQETFEATFKIPSPHYTKGINGFKMALKDFRSDYNFIHLRQALEQEKISLFSPRTFPLTLSYAADSEQSFRDRMEDDHFILDRNDFFLCGVFDGHGDRKQVSSYAAKHFPELFFTFLEDHDVITACEKALTSIHEAVKSEQLPGGSTATICCLNKITNLITTVTLGDSYAALFRKTQDGKVIPLPQSCKRNWKTDADQAYAYFKNTYGEDDPDTLDSQTWKTTSRDPKDLRVESLNVSRCLGNWKFDTATSREPVTTISQVFREDIYLVGCDGVWDYLKFEDLMTLAESSWDNMQILVKKIISESTCQHTRKDCDNVTLIAIKIM